MQTVIDKFSHVSWIMWIIKHFTWRWFPLETVIINALNTLHNELLNGEISYTLQGLIEYWQRYYNAVGHIVPHAGFAFGFPDAGFSLCF